MHNIFFQYNSVIKKASVFLSFDINNEIKLLSVIKQKLGVTFLNLVNRFNIDFDQALEQKKIIKGVIVNFLSQFPSIAFLEYKFNSFYLLSILITGIFVFATLQLLKLRPRFFIQKPYFVLGEGSIDHLCFSIVNQSKAQESIQFQAEAEIINDNVSYRLILERDGEEFQNLKNGKIGISYLIARRIDFSPIDLSPKPVYLKDLNLLLNSPNTILKVRVIAKNKVNGFKLDMEKKYRKIIHNYYEI